MESSSDSSFLVIPDAPSHLDFGIDCMTYETGPKFCGLSMVPVGLHFVHHGAGFGIRQGFFFMAKQNEIVVRPWNVTTEEISCSNTVNESSLAELEKSLKRGDLNKSLGVYPHSQSHIWKNLKSYLNEHVLEKANCGTDKIIFPGDFAESDDAAMSNGCSAVFVDIAGCENVVIESLSSNRDKSVLTALHMDKSQFLDHLIKHEYDGRWEQLMGELQLSFLLFVLLYSYSALNHWKRLVDTICRSEGVLTSVPRFTVAFIRTLHAQLNFSPSDFFTTEISKDNFLGPAVSALMEALWAPPLEPLAEHRTRFLRFLQKKFSLFEGLETAGGVPAWDAFNLVEEDMPVVVTVDEYAYLAGKAGTSTDRGGAAGSRCGQRSGLEECSYDVQAEDEGAFGLGHGAGDVELEGEGGGEDGVGVGGILVQHEGEWVFIDGGLLPFRVPDGGPERGPEGQLMGMGGQLAGPLSGNMTSGDAEGAEGSGGDRDGVVMPRTSSGTSSEGVGQGDDRGADGQGEVQGGVQGEVALTWRAREETLFGWRYPLVFDEMSRAGGAEDMLMTARRLIDEGEGGEGVGGGFFPAGGTPQQRCGEAMLFIENEIRFYS